MPRLIQRKFAWVTTMLAGALVYGGCSCSSSSPMTRPSSGTGSTLRPSGSPAGLLGVVVGVLRNPRETDGGVVADEVHHLRAAVDERVAADLGHDVPDDAVEVELLGLGGVLDPGRLERVVARDPDAAAGARGVAAEVLALLDQQRVEALIGRRPGRRSCRRRRLLRPGRRRVRRDSHLVRGGAQNCNRL